MKNILVVGPAWVGDMVMSQTLYQVLRARLPAARIDVLAPAWSRPLLDRMPEVNASLTLPFRHGELNLKGRWQVAKTLQQQSYQQAILLPNSWKSALIPFWAKIPQRTGWRGELRWGLLNDIRLLDKQRYPLMIERFMALGNEPTEPLPATYPQPQLVITTEQVTAALNQFQLNRHKKILALCPGAEFGPAKRWPEQHYAVVANEFLAQDWQVWLFGSEKDGVVAQRIQQLTQSRCCDLTGKTSLAQAIDLLSLADQVISNDSGLMHIAAALNRQLVVIYGSSDPSFTPPLSKQAQIVRLGLDCSPCFKRECPLQHLNCLQQLLPQQVLDATTELAVE